MRLDFKQWAMGHPCYSLLAFDSTTSTFTLVLRKSLLFPSWTTSTSLAVYKKLSFPPPLHSSFPNSHLSRVHTSFPLFAHSTTTPPLAAGYNPNTSPATN